MLGAFWIWCFYNPVYLKKFQLFQFSRSSTKKKVSNVFFLLTGADQYISLGVCPYSRYHFDVMCLRRVLSFLDLARVEDRDVGRKSVGVWSLEDMQIHSSRTSSCWMLHWILWPPKRRRWWVCPVFTFPFLLFYKGKLSLVINWIFVKKDHTEGVRRATIIQRL